MHHHMAGMHGESMHTDPPGFHGMLLFGEQKLYLSHLPMFMSPHNYQGIFEVTLMRAGSDPGAIYLQDRKKTGTRMYSFAPEENFVLTDLVTPDPAKPGRTSFPGTIWRGHFEDGHIAKKGMPLLQHVIANVSKIVYFQKIELPARKQPLLDYLLFGQDQEYYLAHVITGPPDFDQFAGVRLDSPAASQSVMHLSFPDRSNDFSSRIEEHESLSGQLAVAGGNAPVKTAIQVGTEWYVETSDLAGAM